MLSQKLVQLSAGKDSDTKRKNGSNKHDLYRKIDVEIKEFQDKNDDFVQKTDDYAKKADIAKRFQEQDKKFVERSQNQQRSDLYQQ